MRRPILFTLVLMGMLLVQILNVEFIKQVTVVKHGKKYYTKVIKLA